MCKILAVTGGTGKQTAQKVISVANDLLKTQRDGFGFLATDGEKKCWNRYLNPDKFSLYKDLPTWITGPVDFQGEMPDRPNVILMHGRASTNRVCLENVHPFNVEENYAIHNGVLYWVGEKEKEPIPSNGCDSEAYTMWLAEGNDPSLSSVDWSGWGAIFFYSAQNELTLIKGDVSLYAAKRKRFGWVFGTSPLDVMGLCERCNLEILNKPMSLPPSIVKFDNKGEIKERKHFVGFHERQWNSQANHSMGFHCSNLPEHYKHKGAATTKEIIGEERVIHLADAVGNPYDY